MRRAAEWVGRVVVGMAAGAALAACSSASDATAPSAAVATAPARDTTRSATAACMVSSTGASVCPAGSSSAGGWQLVSVGGDHTCALKITGAAFCWGSNRDGQLGTQATATACNAGGSPYPCSTTPIPVRADLRFISISAGARHTCGITADASAVCWGADDAGQVSGAGSVSPAGAHLPGGNGWMQISAGFSHTCAVRNDGAVFCWGANDRGQIGDGSVSATSAAVRVVLPEAAASVSAGQQRTCARTLTNAVYCWGAIWTTRQDGWEMSRTQPTPEAVAGAPALGTLSVGGFTTCGSDGTGAAYCWEANPRGEMGTGTENGSVTPMRVATSVSLGHVTSGMLQSCGVATSGAAYCWGDDTFGELGVPPASLSERCDRQALACSTTPIQVSGNFQFAQISTGLGSHTCGVTTGGDIACWGLGVSGQRGDGSSAYMIATPTVIAGAQ